MEVMISSMMFASGSVARNSAITLLVLGLFVLSSGKSVPNPTNILDGRRDGIGDVLFQFGNLDDVSVGQAIVLPLQVENHSSSKRTLAIFFAVRTKNDNGVPATIIKNRNFEVVIRSHIAMQINMGVKAEDYEGKLNDQRHLRVSCVISVIETGQDVSSIFDLELRKPQAKK